MFLLILVLSCIFSPILGGESTPLEAGIEVRGSIDPKISETHHFTFDATSSEVSAIEIDVRVHHTPTTEQTSDTKLTIQNEYPLQRVIRKDLDEITNKVFAQRLIYYPYIWNITLTEDDDPLSLSPPMPIYKNDTYTITLKNPSPIQYKIKASVYKKLPNQRKLVLLPKNSAFIKTKKSDVVGSETVGGVDLVFYPLLYYPNVPIGNGGKPKVLPLPPPPDDLSIIYDVYVRRHEPKLSMTTSEMTTVQGIEKHGVQLDESSFSINHDDIFQSSSSTPAKSSLDPHTHTIYGLDTNSAYYVNIIARISYSRVSNRVTGEREQISYEYVYNCGLYIPTGVGQLLILVFVIAICVPLALLGLFLLSSVGMTLLGIEGTEHQDGFAPGQDPFIHDLDNLLLASLLEPGAATRLAELRERQRRPIVPFHKIVIDHETGNVLEYDPHDNQEQQQQLEEVNNEDNDNDENDENDDDDEMNDNDDIPLIPVS